MSRSLLARIEALEQAANVGADPLYVVIAWCGQDKPLAGYSWHGGEARREPGESDDHLRERAERESLRALTGAGGVIVLTEHRGADWQRRNIPNA